MAQQPYKLRLPNRVVELIRHMHPHLMRKIRAALDTIATEPHSGKALTLKLSGLRSFRVGRFRIVYKVMGENEIQIITIGPRTYIYEETLRFISREE
jgi:mRNA interferase RelE/StbE